MSGDYMSNRMINQKIADNRGIDLKKFMNAYDFHKALEELKNDKTDTIRK